MILKRVEPISAGKISGAISALLGLIGGVMMTFVSLIGIAAGAQPNGPPLPALIFGIGGIIFFPLLYGVFGFFGGMLYAAVYNFVSGFVGGLEVEFV